MSTKINAMVDCGACQWQSACLQGKPRTNQRSQGCWPHIRPRATVVADRGYDARAIIDLIAAHGGRAHIPTQRDRKVQRSVDATLYRKRNLVERFFNKLKHFRKIATRYEKTARNYLAAVLIASSRIWLRFYEAAA